MKTGRTYLFALLAFLPACSHGSSGFVPVAPNAMLPASFASQSATMGAVKIWITIPAATKPLRPRYVSPSSQSAQVKVYNKQHTTLLATQNANLSKGSKGCNGAPKSLVCTIKFDLAAGSYTFDTTLFDKPNQQGNKLSALMKFPGVVKAGNTTTLPLVLGGLAKSIAVIPPRTEAVTGTQAGGFNLIGNAPQNFTILTVDADGNYIVGPGSPAAVMVGTPANTTVKPPVVSTSLVWTITSTYKSATNPTVPAKTTLSVKATPKPNSGGSTVSASIPLSVYQPWIYAINYGGSGTTAVTAYDESGNAKTLTGGFSGLSEAGYAVYSPSSGVLYVSNYSSTGTVHPYDAMGNAKTVSGTFPNIHYPGQMALDQTTGTIYMPNYEGPPGVTAYDLQGNPRKLLATAFPGMNGSGAWLMTSDNLDQLLYAVNYSSSVGGQYTPAGTTTTTIGAFPYISNPYGLTYDSGNGLVYGANDQSAPPNMINAYNSKGAQQPLSGSFTGITYPYGIAYDPYNGNIYVANHSSVSGSIVEMDEHGNVLTTTGTFPGVNDPYGILVVP